MSVVMQISDHVVVLEYGRKISDGDPTSVKSDPRVIAAYLGVDDDEVTDVLAEVGDEQVIEELDAEPDRAHGPSDSASMMAGPVSDTVGHSDEAGEIVKISRSASKAEQYDQRAAGGRLQRAGRAARRRARQADPHQGHRAGQREEAARARHLPFRPDRGVDRSRRQGGRSLSGIRRAHRARGLDRPGEGACSGKERRG